MATSEFKPREYWESRLQKDFALSGVGYLGFGKNFNNWMYRLRRRVFLDTVRSLQLPLHSVADFGVGTGFYIDRWVELGAQRISGADITDVAVTQLQAKFPAFQFVQADLGEPVAPFPANSFDAASSMDVLFHIVDDERFKNAIRNIYSMLKPGGTFIFSDNFIHGDTARTTHQVSRSLADIENIVREAGFQIIERRPMFVLLNAPVDAKRAWVMPLWQKMIRRLTKTERRAFVGGGLLFGLDSVLVKLVSESPTTEIMVCRK